jgi:hypothetical protein
MELRPCPHPICTAIAVIAAVVPAIAPGQGSASVVPSSAVQQLPVADSVWNDARALALMEMARERRSLPLADTTLDNYQGRAEGLVYFYLDRRDVDERVLIRTDQVALDVFWAQPDLTKQRIIGLRDESSLPNRMYYHLDHLTVVQNGFGDVMRMGDGDEVRDVPHPAAPGSGTVYDFRLADSLTIRLAGAPDPIKAYRIEVRPKEPDQPAFVGTVYVDHAQGDIVRMTFTFTPVSYIDPRLDHINVSLDNSLWRGRYWLPYEQSVEIRRQVPQLDFLVSSVIQARFRVSDYQFNRDLPESLFWGYRVVTVPREQREAYEFDRGIYEDLLDAGLAPPPELREIRATAARLIRDQALSGLPRLRLSLPNVSAAFRFNRAEGLHLGWGSSFRPSESTRVEVVGGYAFGNRQASVQLGLVRDVGVTGRVRMDGYRYRLRDIGPRPGAAGAFNTLAAFQGDDYTDPFFASGATLMIEHRADARTQLGLRFTLESHRNATLDVEAAPFGGDTFRPVRPVEEGTLFSARVSVERPPIESDRLSLGGRVDLEAGVFESRAFFAPGIDIGAVRVSGDRRSTISAGLLAGAVFGTPAPQQLFLMGGRQTIPGFAFRSFAGDVFTVARVELARDLLFPFVRGRLTGTTGWTDLLDDDPSTSAQARVPATWNTATTGGLRTSIGAGIGLGWDLLRLDLVRGLGSGGEWQFLMSIDPRFWPIL